MRHMAVPRFRTFLGFVLVSIEVVLSTSQSKAESPVEIVDTWEYTLRKPPRGWYSPDFDASNWKTGRGGFGTPQTPQARVGTIWRTSNIWLRKTYNLDAIPKLPALHIHHDEDADVYLNGRLLMHLNGYTTEYVRIGFPQDKLSLLKKGKNILAVHCRQTTGDQFVDVHLTEADHSPRLHGLPHESQLVTTWGESVAPHNVWTEYPRPQLRRPDWTNLNGRWQYAITDVAQASAPHEWDGQILVPFCLESKLGGVKRLLQPDQALWYRCDFNLEKTDHLQQLLNFEAVDYRCAVFVNGVKVGGHQGGNTPFSFDITDAVKNGENELVVRVEDATEKFQLRGKQTLNPRGIWYTQVSGIWQTVWLEQVNVNHLEDLKISTDAGSGTITVLPVVQGSGIVHVEVRDDGETVAQGSTSDEEILLTVPSAKLWSPESPFLYELIVELHDSEGNVVDRVESYAGIRSVGKTRDAEGHLRFTLNGKQTFHWGTLDQGWWPDGLLTPPSDEAMLFDIEWLKQAGFNMIRKHIKVEPRRYYYHCDRIGMLVWQDHVSGGKNPQQWTRLEPNPEDAVWPDDEHRQFMLELERMIGALENHPSIVVWVPFNERWGQHSTMEVGEWIVDRDPSRQINIASGGNFWPIGDIVDAHKYPHPAFPFKQGETGRFDNFIKVIGEFGGHGFPVKNHLWKPGSRQWGYGGLPSDKEEWKERYIVSLRKLSELRSQGIAGGVYTQTTDVEDEINGLLTYDRKVSKIQPSELFQLHQQFLLRTDSADQANSNQ